MQELGIPCCMTMPANRLEIRASLSTCLEDANGDILQKRNCTQVFTICRRHIFTELLMKKIFALGVTYQIRVTNHVSRLRCLTGVMVVVMCLERDPLLLTSVQRQVGLFASIYLRAVTNHRLQVVD